MSTRRLIHLNGPPGIGKSTIARRYVAEHPGVLDCDIDVLRNLVGGWRDDVGEASRLIRSAALALITAYLEGGHDVVLPQLVARPDELARFEAAAHAADAEFVEVMLMDDREAAVARFHRRGTGDVESPLHGDDVRAVVTAGGGDALLGRYYDELTNLAARRPGTIVVRSVEGEVGATYRAVLRALR
jgi:predicted kinase